MGHGVVANPLESSVGSAQASPSRVIRDVWRRPRRTAGEGPDSSLNALTALEIERIVKPTPMDEGRRVAPAKNGNRVLGASSRVARVL